MLRTRSGKILVRLKLLTECSGVGEWCEGTAKVYLLCAKQVDVSCINTKAFYAGKSRSQLIWYSVVISKAATLWVQNALKFFWGLTKLSAS